MKPQKRYEIRNLIGSGDFAAVYRAHDVELNREVALKQIHQQYLLDPQRLERFWREAQLLAAVEHPHIMTVYDIVRPQGWLIVELMQGTMLDACRGKSIDLNLLRGLLAGSLQGLAMLHSRRTIHGDIKPSNLLLDKFGQVKLGDFGLARRVADDQGSYLKGATRYMAPELAAPQFGPVGPASDLYSLGFTAYELLCGPKFETLFPGFEAFGRDKQIAWMMWHAAPDRKLPEIRRVLEGVPEDLARLIDKLTQKDQSRRYRTANEALADLELKPLEPKSIHAAAEAEAAESRRRTRRRRWAAGAAMICSSIVSVLVAFPPSFEQPPPPPVVVDEVMRGVVRKLLPDRQLMIIELADTAAPKEVVLQTSDRILLNDKICLLRELNEQDQVVVHIHQDERGIATQEVQAARPQKSKGTVASLTADEGALAVTLETGEKLELVLAANADIALNGETKVAGRSLALADLLPGDAIVVEHFHGEAGEVALHVVARRMISANGVVRDVNAKKGLVTIAATSADNAPLQVLPFASQCEITLNGRRVLAGRLLVPADLRPGDRVEYDRDLVVSRVAALRKFQATGSLDSIRYDLRSFTLRSGGQERAFLLAANCPLKLGDEIVSFDDLRRGDQVEVSYDEPDTTSPAVESFSAQRPTDPSKWALVTVCGTFEDGSIGNLPELSDNAAALSRTLTARYGIPAEQVIVLDAPSRVRWEQSWTNTLAKVANARQLIVVVLGKAVITSKGVPLVVPKDFAADQLEVTGLPLAGILGAVDRCPAPQKFVLLDLQTGGEQALSAARCVESVLGTKSAPLLRTTPVIATDVSPSGPRLGKRLAAAFAGGADPNRDNLCELTEVLDFLQNSASTAEGPAVKLFLPNNTPPRLTEDAREAIRKLALVLGPAKVDVDEARQLFAAARDLSPKQPEAPLLLGLALLKSRQHADALKELGALAASRPSILQTWEASAWTRFEKLNYAGTISDLTQLVGHFPADDLPGPARRVLPWMGRLREFTAEGAAADRRPSAAAIEALDAAVSRHGAEATRLYEQGRSEVRMVFDKFDRDLAVADATKLKLTYERRNPRYYVSFAPEPIVAELLAGLEE